MHCAHPLSENARENVNLICNSILVLVILKEYFPRYSLKPTLWEMEP